MPELENGVAIVTGAGSGMGRAIALRFAELGTNVVAVGRSAGNIEDTADMGKDLRGAIVPCIADVGVQADVQRMVEQAIEKFGRLDFAANVAGIAAEPKLLHKMSLEEFEDDHAVNSRGVFLGMKYQIPAMLASGGGSIVNVTSAAGYGGFAYFAPYCAAKHAATGMTKAAALEYADKGIRINCVAPGAIATPLLMRNTDEVLQPMILSTPMRRIGRAEEIAAATIWLCSDQASYITGQTLPVEGGSSASALTIVSAHALIQDGVAWATEANSSTKS